MRRESASRRVGEGPRDVDRSVTMSAAALLGGVGAGPVGLHGDDGRTQVVEGVAEPRVGELVPRAPAVGHGDDQAAVPQAREMVGEPGAGDAEEVGEVGRIGRLVAQGEQDAAADRVGERAAEPGQRVQAVPAAGTNVPIWILGSSLFGAQLAAEFGLPYAFASHFAPAQLIHALRVYRTHFRPSPELAQPYAMVGVNIIAAETDAEARRLATTQQMSFVNLFRGTPGRSQPPIDDIDSYWLPHEEAQARAMLGRSIIGSPETVRAGIAAMVAETGADELIVVSDVYDHATRLRSFELIAAAAGLSARERRAA